MSLRPGWSTCRWRRFRSSRPDVRVVQESLGWYAADVEADTAPYSSMIAGATTLAPHGRRPDAAASEDDKFSSLHWVTEAQVQQVVAHDAEGLQIEHDHEVHVGFVVARDEQVLPRRTAHVPRIDDPVAEVVAIEFRRRDGVDVAP